MEEVFDGEQEDRTPTTSANGTGPAGDDGVLRWITKTFGGGSVRWTGGPPGSAERSVSRLREAGHPAWVGETVLDEIPPSRVTLDAVGVATHDPSGRVDVVVLAHPLGEITVAERRRAVVDAVAAGRWVVLPTLDGVDASEIATLFAEHGFFEDVPAGGNGPPRGGASYRDLRLPESARPRRGALGGALGLLADERNDAEARYRAALAEHDRLADRYNALAAQLASTSVEAARRTGDLEDEIARQRDEIVRLGEQAVELEILRRRRAAESRAATDAARQVEKQFGVVVAELGAERAAIQAEREAAAAVRVELDALKSTKLIRYSRRFRGIYGRVRRLRSAPPAPMVVPAPIAAPPAVEDDTDYDLWVRLFDTMDDERRSTIRGRLEKLDVLPTVSVLLPVYDPPIDLLRRAIDSVVGQIYPHWELCIADDASRDPAVRQLLEEYDADDERIRIEWRTENGHIAAASNSALALASGDWVVALDHDDELAEHALALAVLAAAEHPGAGLVYSDEDKIDGVGHRSQPFFKPEFDPLLLLAQNYLCHLTMLRRDLVELAGRYREGSEGSQDWDLALRVSELVEPEQVVHVPYVLYHWRVHAASTALDMGAKPYAVQAGRRAVADAVDRRGLAAETIVNGASGLVRVKWNLPSVVPKVSIVIPTRDGPYLSRCIESIARGTGYANYEVVVVDNGSIGQPTLEFLSRSESWLKVVRDERPFNYSGLNNGAIAHCSGEIICLLNDDCEAIHYDWLEEMVGQLLQEGVGAVGAKLLYGDGRVQHGGVLLGVGGVANHAHRLSDRLSTGHFNRLFAPHSLSAVTGACMLVRRAAYEQVGGLDEVNLPIAFNDVDFCLRLREAGWRIVWTPFAELTHYESVTRGADTGARAEGFAREVRYMVERWGDVLRQDPSYNPNLTLEHERFSLAFPPRVTW
jgi:GT2 family glycosyltransferase